MSEKDFSDPLPEDTESKPVPEEDTVASEPELELQSEPYFAEADDALREKLEQIETLLLDGFATLEKRERILDDLHRENQKHRGSLLLSAMDPIIKSLVRLHDDMLDTLERAETDGEKMTRQKVLDDMEFYWQEIVETLARQGISAYRDEPGVPFDARRHQIVKTVPTDDPGENGKVIEVRRSGFAVYEDSDDPKTQTKVVRPQLVVVGKYQPPPVTEREGTSDSVEEPRGRK